MVQLYHNRNVNKNSLLFKVDYTRSDIKILKQIHSLGDEQYKRLLAYMKALKKLETMESIVEEQN